MEGSDKTMQPTSSTEKELREATTTANFNTVFISSSSESNADYFLHDVEGSDVEV